MSTLIRFCSGALVLASAALGGCASYSKLNPAFIGEEPAAMSDDRHIVVVRILTGVDEESAPNLRQRYISQAYFGGPKSGSSKVVDPNMLDQSVAKTTFYAFQTFEALRKALPDAVVIPQPVTLSTDSYGNAAYTSNLDVPTPTVVVDFFAYVDPEWTPDIVQPFSTVGRTVMPIYSVRTWPHLSSNTSGAVSGMEMLAPLVSAGNGSGAFAGAGANIVEFLNCRCENAHKRDKGKTYLVDAEELTRARAWAPDSFLAWPLYKLNFESLERLDGKSDMAADPSVKTLAWIIRDALAVASADENVNQHLLAQRLEYYDPDAAEAVRDGVKLEASKADLFAKIERAELQYFRNSAEAFVDSHLTEELRTSFMEIRKKEQEHVRNAKAMSWVGIVASAALVSAAADSGSTASLSNAQITMTALMDTMEDSFNNMAQSIDQAQGRFGAQQTSLSITLAEREAEIVASDIHELRAKLKAHYEKITGPRSAVKRRNSTVKGSS